MKTNIIIKPWLIVIIIITIFQVQAVPAGTEYTVTNIQKCYGNIQIKLRGEFNITNIEFPKCTYNENNLWICPCRNPTNIKFNTENITRGKFNLAIQYNIAKPTGSGVDQQDVIRTKQFNNIVIGPPIKRPFEWPTFSFGSTAFIVIAILFGISAVAGVIYTIKKMFFEEDEEDKKIQYTDEEIIEWVNKIEQNR